MVDLDLIIDTTIVLEMIAGLHNLSDSVMARTQYNATAQSLIADVHPDYIQYCRDLYKSLLM